LRHREDGPAIEYKDGIASSIDEASIAATRRPPKWLPGPRHRLVDRRGLHCGGISCCWEVSCMVGIASSIDEASIAAARSRHRNGARSCYIASSIDEASIAALRMHQVYHGLERIASSIDEASIAAEPAQRSSSPS